MGEDIFISYCREDIAKAKRIKEELERSTSAKCWIDLFGIESGSQFEDVIISAIDKSRLVIFLLSENSMQSRWAKDEIRYAYETGKKIIPVNIDKCTPSGWFLFRFSGYDVIDISDSFQKAKFLRNVAEWIRNSNGPDPKPVSVDKKKKKSTHIDPYLLFEIGHFLVFGTFFILMFRLNFHGYVANPKGYIAMRFNILLCVCLIGTLYSIYLLFTKTKKIAVYLIVTLDVFEIILLCLLANQIANYGYKLPNGYKTFLYVQLNGLGLEIIKRGGVVVTTIMELFALIHILLLVGILFIKIKGIRLWDRLQ